MGILEKGALVEHMMSVADHIEAVGWTRGSFGDCSFTELRTGHCVSGAAYCVQGGLDSEQLPENYIGQSDLATALGFMSVNEMQQWNDAQPDGSAVIELLRRKAIRVAEST